MCARGGRVVGRGMRAAQSENCSGRCEAPKTCPGGSQECRPVFVTVTMRDLPLHYFVPAVEQLLAQGRLVDDTLLSGSPATPTFSRRRSSSSAGSLSAAGSSTAEDNLSAIETCCGGVCSGAGCRCGAVTNHRRGCPTNGVSGLARRAFGTVVGRSLVALVRWGVAGAGSCGTRAGGVAAGGGGGARRRGRLSGA